MNGTSRIHTDKDDEELVELIKEGNKPAFEEVIVRYREKAYNIAYGLIRDEEEAKDISQEVFLRVFENIQKFSKRSSFYTWFYRIEVNLVYDFLRKRKRVRYNSSFESNEKIAQIPDGERLDEVFEENEKRKKVVEALGKLSKKERIVMELKHYQGMKISEIAEILRSSEGTIKAQLFKGLRKLQKILRREL